MKYDVCIVGSGAGAGPVIYKLANAGFKVLVLEKGPWLKTEHFSKDDMTATRRNIYAPALKDEFHVLETKDR
jgi:choline dehydrogenase-like flavoprotein